MPCRVRRLACTRADPSSGAADEHHRGNDDGEEHQARDDGRKRVCRKKDGNPPAEARTQRGAGAFESDQREQQADAADDNRGRQQEEWNGQDGHGGDHRPARGPQRPAPAVEAGCRAALPEAVRLPQARATVDGREERRHRADPTPRHEIDLDARFVQRAEHARMVGTGSSGSGEHERRSKAGRVNAVRTVGRDHGAAGLRARVEMVGYPAG